MKRNLVISIILVLVILLTACGSSTGAKTGTEAKTFKIGMANFSQCCPYFIGMNNAIIDESKLYSNVTIISTNADGDSGQVPVRYRGSHCPEGRRCHYLRRLA